MLRMACIAVSAALLLTVDVQQMSQLRSPSHSQSEIPPDQSVSIFPEYPAASEQGTAVTQSAAAELPNSEDAEPKASAPPRSGPMQDESRLEIQRYVNGEFARMVMPLPGSKKGFHIKAGKPLDQDALRKAIASNGAALNPGDNVQITKLDFLSRGIALELNGGGNGRRTWRDRIQIQVGAGGIPIQTSTSTSQRSVAVAEKAGATFYLDFDRPLPDMTPDQVKEYLSAVLDFSKQRSAAVQWIETLPPEIQQAIQEKRAEAGMDREQVLAAIGRPDRKVRERDLNGNEIEDWIYGRPPSPTVFVRFSGEKVTRISQYP